MRSQLFLVILAGVIGSLCISGAASAFEAITIVGPYMKSSWRLQLTSFCYLILVFLTWSTQKESYSQMLKNDWKKIIISGTFLGLHYCLWTLSLDLTSVAHSLLFISASPLFVVFYHMARCNHIRYEKVVGVVIGFAGMVILCIQGKNNEGSTVFGDIIALAGSFAIWFNYVVSENLVHGMPWFFLWFMHGVAATFCWFASMIEAFIIDGTDGYLRFLQTFEYLYEFQGIYAVCLGVVVGFIGGGSFYYMLRHTSPLVITVILFFEPVTGSLFAWLCGFQKDPSIYTWIGGAIIFVGNFIVSIFSELKNQE